MVVIQQHVKQIVQNLFKSDSQKLESPVFAEIHRAFPISIPFPKATEHPGAPRAPSLERSWPVARPPASRAAVGDG